MAENKTTPTDADVDAFVAGIDDQRRRADSLGADRAATGRLSRKPEPASRWADRRRPSEERIH